MVHPGGAGFAHGLFGIGFAMIAMPLLALFLDNRLAVVLAAVPLLTIVLGWLCVHRDSTLDPLFERVIQLIAYREKNRAQWKSV